MKMRVFEKNKGFLAQAIAFAMASFWVTACTSSNEDGGFVGGTTEDAGIIADLNVAGVTQKGPFAKGSAVAVQGIDCKTLKFTDETFEGSVKNDKGEFVVDNVTLSSTCAVFEVSGYYLNELTGKKSSEKLTLHALTNLKDRKHVNINMLTELEYKRVMNLVSEEKMSFDDAKKQAEKEVLASFNVNGDYALSEDLNIFENGDGNAALLAVSVLVQVSGDSSKNVNVAERVDNFGTAIAENGSLDNSAKTEMADWAAMAESNGQMAKIRKNLENLGYADEIPAFENVVEEFAQTVIPASSESSSSIELGPGTSSSGDKPYTPPCYKECMDWSIPKEDYLNPEIKYGEITDDRDGQVYKTVKIGNQVWMAQNLNYFTSDMSYRASCHGGKTQHCDVAGRLYTWAVAMDSVKKAKDGVYACGDGKICTSTENYQGICPDGWHLPTKAEWDSLLSFVGGMPAASKILKSRVGWNNDGNGLDVVGFSALPAGDEFDGTGAYRNEGLGTSFWSVTEYYSVGAQVLRLSYNDEASAASYDLKERSLSIRCINDDGIIEYPSSSSAKSSSSQKKVSSSSSSVNDGDSSSSSSKAFGSSSSVNEFDWSLPKESYLNPEIEYGEMIDARDGQVYKTVKIGEQTWMAENLNYADSAQTPSLLGHNWCYDNDPEKCEVAGRLYTWSAAIDSADFLYNNKRCGYNRDTCFFSKNYRGICPEGWHLPDTTEWKDLFKSVNRHPNALRSMKGWNHSANGNDDVGFSGAPVGVFSKNAYSCLRERCFNSSGEGTVYISLGDYGYYGVVSFCLDYDDHDLGYRAYSKDEGYSVRCVKD